MLENIRNSLVDKVRGIGKSVKENKSAYLLAGILLATPIGVGSCVTAETGALMGAGAGMLTGSRHQSGWERAGRGLIGAGVGSIVGSAIEQNQQPRRVNKYCTDCGRIYTPDMNYCPYDSTGLQWR